MTHAGSDSDKSVVYFSLTINDKNKIIKAETSKTIGEIGKSQLTECYVIQNIVVCFFDRPNVFSELFYFPDPSVMLWYIYESVMIS